MLFVFYTGQTENSSEGLAPDHQSYTRLCFWQGIHRKVIASDFAVQQEFFETVAAQNVCLLQTVWWWPSEMKDASGIYMILWEPVIQFWKDWCIGRHAADTWQISLMMIAFQMHQDGQHVGKETTSSWQVTHNLHRSTYVLSPIKDPNTTSRPTSIIISFKIQKLEGCKLPSLKIIITSTFTIHQLLHIWRVPSIQAPPSTSVRPHARVISGSVSGVKRRSLPLSNSQAKITKRLPGISRFPGGKPLPKTLKLGDSDIYCQIGWKKCGGYPVASKFGRWLVCFLTLRCSFFNEEEDRTDMRCGSSTTSLKKECHKKLYNHFCVLDLGVKKKCLVGHPWNSMVTSVLD